MSAEEFETIVQKIRPRLVKVAAKIVGNADAEDAVQDALLTVMSALQNDQLREVEDLNGYLVAAVQNAARMFARSEDRHVDQMAEYVARADVDAVVEDVERLDARIDVRRVISKLPKDLQEVFVKVYADGATWREVAEELGIDHTTLYKQAQKWVPFIQEQLGSTNEPPSASGSMEGENDADG